MSEADNLRMAMGKKKKDLMKKDKVKFFQGCFKKRIQICHDRKGLELHGKICGLRI